MNEATFELIKRRSPVNLAKFCLDYKDWVSKNDFNNGLLRKNEDYKFFIDEVWPLSNFCSVVLDESYEIEPIKGNQGFDAKVYKKSGEFQFNIEIVFPQDGAKRADDSRQFINNGTLSSQSSPPSDLESFIEKIKKVCDKKSQKDYSDSWLLFNIITGAVSESQYEEFVPAMEKVQRAVEKFNFQAKLVYLYFSPFKHVIKIGS